MGLIKWYFSESILPEGSVIHVVLRSPLLCSMLVYLKGSGLDRKTPLGTSAAHVGSRAMRKIRQSQRLLKQPFSCFQQVF